MKKISFSPKESSPCKPMQAHASPCNSLLVAASFFFSYIVPLYAEGNSTSVIQSSGTSINVELTGLVEGLTAGSEVVVRNNSGISFTNLLAKATCGCLKPVDIDGGVLKASEDLPMKFVFLPTADVYSQSCVISGVDDSGKRIDVVKIGFKGNVTPPVKFDRISVLPDEVKSGRFVTKIHSLPEVIVKYSSIQSLSDSVKVDADELTGEIRFSWKVKPQDSDVKIRIPLTHRSRNYDYFIAMNFVDELISIAPSQLFFSWKNNEDLYVARCVVKTVGFESSKSDFFVVPFAKRDGMEEPLKDGVISLTCRQVGQNSLVVECRVSKENSESLRGSSISFSAKGIRSKSILCSFD